MRRVRYLFRGCHSTAQHPSSPHPDWHEGAVYDLWRGATLQIWVGSRGRASACAYAGGPAARPAAGARVVVVDSAAAAHTEKQQSSMVADALLRGSEYNRYRGIVIVYAPPAGQIMGQMWPWTLEPIGRID